MVAALEARVVREKEAIIRPVLSISEDDETFPEKLVHHYDVQLERGLASPSTGLI